MLGHIRRTFLIGALQLRHSIHFVLMALDPFTISKKRACIVFEVPEVSILCASHR